MSQLSDIWGASDVEKPYLKPRWEDKPLDLTNPVVCMVSIHRKIVEAQAKYNNDMVKIDTNMLRFTTGMVVGAWEAIISLDTGYFEDRPANKRRLMMVAQRLSLITIEEWLDLSATKAQIITDEEVFNGPLPK